MNNKIIKLQQGDYFKWKNLSREGKVKRNKQIAKQYLDKGPSIQNYYNALKAYFGGFNPKNPYLQTGEPIILPGINPTKGIQTATNVARTLEDYLKTTKVTAQALEGSSASRSAYATDRFIGGRLFQNTLPEEAMKIQGHGMAKSPTIQDALARLRYILDNGIKGKFYTAPLKVSKEAAMAGEAIGTGGATPYFDGHFLITGKPGQMINSVDDIGTIYINDAYENEEALKAAQKIKEYLTKTYPNKVFKLYSEGFKKGGSIKAANARKWKHEKGGKAFVNGVSILDSNKDAYKYVKKKYKMRSAGDGMKISKAQEGDKLTGWQKVGNFLNSDYGNLILNGVQQGLSYFGNKPKSTKANKEAFIKNYIAQNSVNPNQFYQQAYQQQVTSPDVHASDIVARNTAYKLAQQYNAKLKNDANAAWAQYQTMQNSGQQSSSNDFLGTAFSMLGKFIGPKSTTTTDGQTEIATPEKAIQTTASPKIPSVYTIAEKQILPIWQNIQNPVSNIGQKQQPL